jgi:hypothetical protein
MSSPENGEESERHLIPFRVNVRSLRQRECFWFSENRHMSLINPVVSAPRFSSARDLAGSVGS